MQKLWSYLQKPAIFATILDSCLTTRRKNVAYTKISGKAADSNKRKLGPKIDPFIREIIKLGEDPRELSFEITCDGCYIGYYRYYIVIECDPTPERLEGGQGMANDIRDSIKAMGDNYEHTGVWLDLGAVRFWAG